MCDVLNAIRYMARTANLLGGASEIPEVVARARRIGSGRHSWARSGHFLDMQLRQSVAKMVASCMKVVATVTNKLGANSDEEFACRLLTGFLTEQGRSGFGCRLNPNDPPDILVAWDDCSQWGVEVSRTYQQVARDGGNDVISSADITEPLRRFGQKLGAETKDIRKRDYTLGLGPSPAVSLGMQQMTFDRVWKKKSGAAIRQHMEAGRTDILRCPGVWFKPGGLGNRWSVNVSPGVAEINRVTSAMLERALEEKTRALPRWTGIFTRRWLMLLNCYPLVDDICEVEVALERLIRGNSNMCGFDGVFWSGLSDRTLVLIPMAPR